jgi:hypothetical protein
MRTTPPIRFALLAVAAALLVAGLAGPIRRGLEERERAQKARDIAQQVASERAEASARFNANRAQIIAQLRGLVERGEYVEALRVAAPFGAIPDQELRDLYKEAAGAESQRQRRMHYSQLVERDCNEGFARQQIARLFATVPEGSRPDAPERLVRIVGTEATQRVLARMREPAWVEPRPAGQPGAAAPATTDAAHADPARPRDWVAVMRDDHRARLLPDYLGFVLSPNADPVICVWRAEGGRRAGDRVLRYTLDAWLAPSPDLKGLVADPAVYGERPAGAS